MKTKHGKRQHRRRHRHRVSVVMEVCKWRKKSIQHTNHNWNEKSTTTTKTSVHKQNNTNEWKAPTFFLVDKSTICSATAHIFMSLLCNPEWIDILQEFWIAPINRRGDGNDDGKERMNGCVEIQLLNFYPLHSQWKKNVHGLFCLFEASINNALFFLRYFSILLARDAKTDTEFRTHTHQHILHN